jgi:hypothetical protein
MSSDAWMATVPRPRGPTQEISPVRIHNSVAHITTDAEGRVNPNVGLLPEGVNTIRIHREPSAETDASFAACAEHNIPADLARNYQGSPMSEIERDIRRVSNIRAICAATSFTALTDVFVREGVSVDTVKAVIVNVRGVIDRSLNIDAGFVAERTPVQAGPINVEDIYKNLNTPKGS